MMKTPRLVLALSTAALLAATLAPSASAVLVWGCSGHHPTLPPEVCEQHPCVTLSGTCRWADDYAQACIDGPILQLAQRIIGCGIP